MAVQFTPEWLSEQAVTNLLKANTAATNLYTSDTTQGREYPCLITTCGESQELKLGRFATANGGYLSGVFQQSVEIALEMKADFVGKSGSQNATVPQAASKLLMQVYQALHPANMLLQDALTAAVNLPYQVFSATLEMGEQSVDAEKRVWRKVILLQLRVMANKG